MYNENTKRNTMKYLAKLKEVRFRVKPEEYEAMREAAADQGFGSMRQFFLDAINQSIERSNEKKAFQITEKDI